jgi:hypothetical protein
MQSRVRNTGARGNPFKQAHEKAAQTRKEALDKPRKMRHINAKSYPSSCQA